MRLHLFIHNHLNTSRRFSWTEIPPLQSELFTSEHTNILKYLWKSFSSMMGTLPSSHFQCEASGKDSDIMDEPDRVCVCWTQQVCIWSRFAGEVRYFSHTSNPRCCRDSLTPDASVSSFFPEQQGGGWLWRRLHCTDCCGSSRFEGFWSWKHLQIFSCMCFYWLGIFTFFLFFRFVLFLTHFHPSFFPQTNSFRLFKTLLREEGGRTWRK